MLKVYYNPKLDLIAVSRTNHEIVARREKGSCGSVWGIYNKTYNWIEIGRL
jgi:hypothetical protein